MLHHTVNHTVTSMVYDRLSVEAIGVGMVAEPVTTHPTHTVSGFGIVTAMELASVWVNHSAHASLRLMIALMIIMAGSAIIRKMITVTPSAKVLFTIAFLVKPTMGPNPKGNE
jgi:hypothetical protein